MEIKTDNGSVKLKLPNFPESMRLIGELGIADGKEINYFETLAFMSEHAERYIEKINVKGIKTYDELLNSSEHSKLINKIVDSLSKRMEEFSAVKKNG